MGRQHADPPIRSGGPLETETAYFGLAATRQSATIGQAVICAYLCESVAVQTRRSAAFTVSAGRFRLVRKSA